MEKRRAETRKRLTDDAYGEWERGRKVYNLWEQAYEILRRAAARPDASVYAAAMSDALANALKDALDKEFGRKIQ